MTMFYVLNVCSDIPCPVFQIAHVIKLLIQWAVPIIIIIYGMLDFAKATMANDESGISKAKQTFIKRLISGASIFFIMSILQLTFSILSSSANNAADGKGEGGEGILECVNLIFSGEVTEDSGLCDNDPFDQEADADADADSDTDTDADSE